MAFVRCLSLCLILCVCIVTCCSTVSAGGSSDDDAGPDPLASRIALNAAPEVRLSSASTQYSSDADHRVCSFVLMPKRCAPAATQQQPFVPSWRMFMFLSLSGNLGILLCEESWTVLQVDASSFALLDNRAVESSQVQHLQPATARKTYVNLPLEQMHAAVVGEARLPLHTCETPHLTSSTKSSTDTHTAMPLNLLMYVHSLI